MFPINRGRLSDNSCGTSWGGGGWAGVGDRRDWSTVYISGVGVGLAPHWSDLGAEMNLRTFNAPDWLATEVGRLTSRASHCHHVGFVSTWSAFKFQAQALGRRRPAGFRRKICWARQCYGRETCCLVLMSDPSPGRSSVPQKQIQRNRLTSVPNVRGL